MTALRVAGLQHDIVWEDRDATLTHLAPQVARAAAVGARMVVLTEMFATGFSMATDRTAEPIDGPILTWLHERAAENDVWMAGSLALADPDGGLPTNTLVVVGPDGTRHRYDKRHPFSYAGEDERFASGKASVIAEIDGVRWGLTVCYDLRFADLYWDLATEVDAYLVVANWPAARRHHWRALIDARAIENQAYVVAVNRIGEGGSLDYAGDSRVVDPGGEVLASAAGSETMLLADIDPAVVTDTRTTLPFLPDRT